MRTFHLHIGLREFIGSTTTKFFLLRCLLKVIDFLSSEVLTSIVLPVAMFTTLTSPFSKCPLGQHLFCDIHLDIDFSIFEVTTRTSPHLRYPPWHRLLTTTTFISRFYSLSGQPLFCPSTTLAMCTSSRTWRQSCSVCTSI